MAASKCQVCKEPYDSEDKAPKVLYCGDDICHSCLVKEFDKNKKLSCPVCMAADPRKPTEIAVAVSLVPNSTWKTQLIQQHNHSTNTSKINKTVTGDQREQLISAVKNFNESMRKLETKLVSDETSVKNNAQVELNRLLNGIKDGQKRLDAITVAKENKDLDALKQEKVKIDKWLNQFENTKASTGQSNGRSIVSIDIENFENDASRLLMVLETQGKATTKTQKLVRKCVKSNNRRTSERPRHITQCDEDLKNYRVNLTGEIVSVGNNILPMVVFPAVIVSFGMDYLSVLNDKFQRQAMIKVSNSEIDCIRYISKKDGQLLCGDRKTNTLMIITLTGDIVAKSTVLPSPPCGITFNNANVYVSCNHANLVVQMTSKDLKMVRHIKHEKLTKPTAIAVVNDQLYVGSLFTTYLTIFDPSGNYKEIMQLHTGYVGDMIPFQYSLIISSMYDLVTQVSLKGDIMTEIGKRSKCVKLNPKLITLCAYKSATASNGYQLVACDTNAKLLKIFQFTCEAV